MIVVRYKNKKHQECFLHKLKKLYHTLEEVMDCAERGEVDNEYDEEYDEELEEVSSYRHSMDSHPMYKSGRYRYARR